MLTKNIQTEDVYYLCMIIIIIVFISVRLKHNFLFPHICLVEIVTKKK